MTSKLVNIINLLLRNLEIIFGICSLIIACGRIINNDLIYKFLDFFGILPVVLLIIWFVWTLFCGRREIIILPSKTKKQLKGVNFNNSEKDKYKLVFIFITLLYAFVMYSNHKGNIFIGGYQDAEKDIYIAATLVYTFCAIFTIIATNTVMPNVEMILEKNLGLKKVRNDLYCKELPSAGISYYFRYDTFEVSRPALPYVERRTIIFRKKIELECTILSAEAIFPESMENAIRQNIDKISEIYDFLIIEINKRENTIILRMKNRSAYYTQTASARYIITLIISMVNAAEQTIL